MRQPAEPGGTRHKDHLEERAMKIVLGADGAGAPLKDTIAAHVAGKAGVEVVDLSKSGFYADIAAEVGRSILAG